MRVPPGPRMPSLLQGMGWWHRPTAFMERCRARYGKRFTIRLPGQPPFVMISEPDELKQIFTAPPDVLHPGEGARILEPIVGRYSVILLDEEPHLEQRKLLLPAFHGDKMQRLTGADGGARRARGGGLAAGRAGRAPSRASRRSRSRSSCAPSSAWTPASGSTRCASGSPRSSSSATRPRRSTRSSSGASAASARTPASRARATRRTSSSTTRSTSAAAPASAATTSSRCCSTRATRTAREMSREEIRDELMTALVAGHETTASELAWAFEALAREPRVLARLHAEIDARRRRRLPHRHHPGDAAPPARAAPGRAAARQEADRRSATGHYPPGVVLAANAWLDPPRPRHLPRPVRLPPRALPRRAARHLHLDPVRRRPPPLPRRRASRCSR